MRKRNWLLLALALLGLVAVHLHPQYRVLIDGTELPGTYSAAELRRAERAAGEAAEEILRYDAKMPALTRRLRLSFRESEAEPGALTDALLQRVSGLTSADAVYVNGIRLGTVADGERLCELLRSEILGQMPLRAVSGNISGRLELRRVYTRADSNSDAEDMIRRITGMAPVIYLDGNGKLA